jgi:hypothetical protein
VYTAKGRIFNKAISAIRALDERPGVRDKPTFSSERMLHKNYYSKDSVEKKNLWSWASRGLTPR